MTPLPTRAKPPHHSEGQARTPVGTFKAITPEEEQTRWESTMQEFKKRLFDPSGPEGTEAAGILMQYAAAQTPAEKRAARKKLKALARK